jgi:TolB-like protein/tetratricopeptide (TPR) repeat protein
VRFHFENQVLDAARRELSRDGVAVPLEPQVFDLLLYLIQNRDRVVSKDDVLDAVWQGRIVSESALTTRVNAARKALGDSGEAQRLIRTVPRRGFRFVAEVSAGEAPPTAPSPLLEVPDRPSIAVLPFANLSGDPDQEYFVDGLVEELITGLSRFRSLLVIARNSSFTYKGRNVDVKQIGRELGVRYVLEGSVRRSGTRLRITGQLSDASDGTQLWADRFEGVLEDVFDLQDELTARVIGGIAPKLHSAEIGRARRKTNNLTAYDYYLRGWAAINRFTGEGHGEARALAAKAIELDPEFALAYALMALCSLGDRAWVTSLEDRPRLAAEAAAVIERALALDPDDARVLTYCGHTLVVVTGRVADGAALLERAVEADSNFASAWAWRGYARTMLGRPEEGLADVMRAMRLSPLDPWRFTTETMAAGACFLSGRSEEAAGWIDSVLRQRPDYPAALRIGIAAYEAVGRREDARRALERYEARRGPNTRIAMLLAGAPHVREEDRERYARAYRSAGVPD